MSFTVTVTYTGSQASAPGLTFDTRVYTGAQEGGGASGATGVTSGTPITVSITPTGTNSLIAFSAGDYSSNTASMSAASNNTLYEAWVSGQNGNAGVVFGHYSSSVTAGTAVSVGITGTTGDEHGVAAYELMSGSGATPALDASSPAQVNSQTGTSGTTAAFSPPPGSVIILLIDIGATNSAGTVSCSVSDTSGLGLVWTQRATESHSGSTGIDGFQTIFTTTVPDRNGISFVGSTTAVDTSSSATLSPVVPAATQAGDLILISCFTGFPTTTFSASNYNVNTASSGTSFSQQILWKWATAADADRKSVV